MTTRQLRMIWSTARKAGFDRDMVYDLAADLSRKSGTVPSVSASETGDRPHDFRPRLHDLKSYQISGLIKRLKHLAGELPPGSDYRQPQLRVDRAGIPIEYCTPAQAYTIRYLSRKLDLTEAELWGRIRVKYLIQPIGHDLSDLTKVQATSLILSLKTLYHQRESLADLAARQGTLPLSEESVPSDLSERSDLV